MSQSMIFSFDYDIIAGYDYNDNDIIDYNFNSF